MQRAHNPHHAELTGAGPPVHPDIEESRVRFAEPMLGANGAEDSRGSGWGATKSAGPVVVIPGTNAAVDALLLISRDDLPIVRNAAMAAVVQIFFPSVQDSWIRTVVLQHIAGLRYQHGSALASAEAAFNQAALEMDAGRRLKLEALCARVRAIYLSQGRTAF